MSTCVQINQISKSYVKGKTVLKPIDLTINAGELFFLLGSSGCGKSTLLRIIAGLLEPDSGTIRFNGTDITHFPPEKRKAAMVFQNYAIFPHLSVRQNVEFGLKQRKMEKEAVASATDKFLKLMQIILILQILKMIVSKHSV